MGDRVGETMPSEITVSLLSSDGATLFEDTGRHAGLELHGDLARLLDMQLG